MKLSLLIKSSLALVVMMSAQSAFATSFPKYEGVKGEETEQAGASGGSVKAKQKPTSTDGQPARGAASSAKDAKSEAELKEEKRAR